MGDSEIENNYDYEIFPKKRKIQTDENFNKRMRGEAYVGHKLVESKQSKVQKPARKVGMFKYVTEFKSLPCDHK